jgi:ATP-binding cassette subfamily B protein
VLRRAAFDSDVQAMPAGLATTVGARGVRLSGGQLQRAATARALTAGPALLALDDLSSALEARTERRVWTRLRHGAPRTVLVVSHRAAALERADQVVLLDAGRVRAAGTWAELRDHGESLRPVLACGSA